MNQDVKTNFLSIISTFDRSDLIDASNLLKARYRDQERQRAGELSVGRQVRFNNKGGQVLNGTVMKVNRRTCLVKDDNGVQWKVSVGLLEKNDGI